MSESLEDLLRRRLELGPITVADYMRLALGHPTLGYYRTRDPLGGVPDSAAGAVPSALPAVAGAVAGGDFVTAPECSQMFGELLGLWSAHVWGLLGQPDPIGFVELGPGRGTLMADALRAVRLVAPGFHAALRVHLVETSPVLRTRQAKALEGEAVEWHERLTDLPPGPFILLANEFLDALPIHQLVKREGQWRERQVGLTEAGDFGFQIGKTASPLARLLTPEVAQAPETSIAEVSPTIRGTVAAISRRLAHYGGAALLIDYGYAEAAAGDSLQAVRRHQYHPVLQDPGEADLTAHVDFSAVGAAARMSGVDVHGPIEQGAFLTRLGILERAQRLVRDADAAKAHDLVEGMHRLIAPDRMGSLFKVIGLGPVGLSALPGFVS
ncbi:class I SAM-dependent methyltransferase [Elstera sp.]|jgi:NADH dehydrogenase [ubiquinone] 1 alpha subcomplex assembly factor 7|uniref:class I SAM-dependent methyltransferase n=1 Tax=Elstera sp. TaxID=1916664 RepID=UPI0037C1AE49